MRLLILEWKILYLDNVLLFLAVHIFFGDQREAYELESLLRNQVLSSPLTRPLNTRHSLQSRAS